MNNKSKIARVRNDGRWHSRGSDVCLVPAATDTSWWHDYALQGEIRYLRGRPRFLTKEGQWQQTFSPSVIVIFRPKFGRG
jgi:hypothetical protein